MIWFNMEIWRYFHSHSRTCPFPLFTFTLSLSRSLTPTFFFYSFHSVEQFLTFLLLFRFGFCMIDVTIQWLNFCAVCLCVRACVHELNNRTLKAKQSRFIAFHLPNIRLSFHLLNIYINTFLQIHSFSWLAKSVRAISRNQQATAFSQPSKTCKREREWMKERERGAGARERMSSNERTSDWRSFCHEQFHANRFIKLGSKTNFKMRLRTISKHHLNFGKLVKVYNSWNRKEQKRESLHTHQRMNEKSSHNNVDLFANMNVSVSYVCVVVGYILFNIHHKRATLDRCKIGWHRSWVSNSSD